jgi:arginyl-tRNA synthetase
MIVQKSDGAYLYATTDLAALRYRCSELGANRIIYVTDARQKMHFQMLFQASRAAGFAPAETRLDHVTFGSVLGEDRKPLKTRSGSNVKLEALLDEAQRRALQLLEQRNSEQPDDVPTPVIDDHSETARGPRHWCGQVRRPA